MSLGRYNMAGYSTTPLWKKLGYCDGLVAYVEGAPTSYVTALALPAEVSVEWLERFRKGCGFVHLFVTSKRTLIAKLSSYRKTISSNGVVWVSWPKKISGVATDITEDIIREVALPLGLVDIKVCAVDEVWSGLKLMIRKDLR